ncbi:MAG: glycosyltransferase [Cyanophyceae cyanobacterium]
MTMLQSKTTSPSKEHPFVSVVIANYNYGCFLSQAIESVLQQTYQNFELLVVDDGSTDRSREILESYRGKMTAIFQANAGQGAAFNLGIARSSGEIVCFLDADDYFRKDKLAKVVAAFQEHPQWVQISHGRISVNREGKPIGQGYLAHSRGDVRPLLLQWGKYAWSITSGLAYRRQTLQKVLPIPTQRSEAADTYLAATVPFYGEVGCIDEPLMFYRMHGNNLQARNDDLKYLLHQREVTAAYINQAALKAGLNQQFDLRRDVDYRSLSVLQQGQSSWIEAWRILWLSLQESIAIGYSPQNTLERFLRRGICALFPAQGKAVLRLGLRGYLRLKLTKISKLPSTLPQR